MAYAIVRKRRGPFMSGNGRPGRSKKARIMARASVRRRPKRVPTLRRKRRVRAKARLQTGLSSFVPPQSKMRLQIDENANQMSTRTLQVVNLCSLTKNVNNVNNERSGQEAFISGFYHRMLWQNLSNAVGPIRIYQLWVIPKNWDPEAVSINTEMRKSLFTAHGLADDKDRSWSTLLASQLYDEPINEAKYTVLKKKAFTLGVYNVNDGFATYRSENFWIPLKRKYTYGTPVGGEGGGDAESDNNTVQPPVIYMQWSCPILQDTGAAVTTAAVRRDAHVVTYFRDGDSM